MDTYHFMAFSKPSLQMIVEELNLKQKASICHSQSVYQLLMDQKFSQGVT